MASTCPCCGYDALEASAAGAALCGICAWDERSRGDLAELQRSFARCGSSDPALAAFTRKPSALDVRPAWWLPLDDAPRHLIALLEEAFDGVGLDGGVSFDEAERIDDYALPARTELDPPPSGFGEGPPWLELTRFELDRYPTGNFAFQDARGLRFHLPAFLRAHLRDLDHPPAALPSLLCTLHTGHQLAALRALLTESQRRAVAHYLAFAAFTEDVAEEAFDALDVWGGDLDPEHFAHLRGVRRGC